jgi:hypothetical protein
MFHHPFQANRGFAGILSATPVTPETPLSPRAAHSTFTRVISNQHEDRAGEVAASGSYIMASGLAHNQQFGNGPGDSYWGAFPPHQQQNTHLLPHFLMNDPYRRDSAASIGYDLPMRYDNPVDGLYGQTHGGYHCS